MAVLGPPHDEETCFSGCQLLGLARLPSGLGRQIRHRPSLTLVRPRSRPARISRLEGSASADHLLAQADGSITFVWRSGDGGVAAVPGRDDFFALADTAVWTHVRTFENPDLVAQRFDFAPHFAALDGLRIDAREMLPLGARVIEDRWIARWPVEEGGEYSLTLSHPTGAAYLKIDGHEVISADGPSHATSASVTLASGDHEIEILFEAGDAPYVGGLLYVANPAGERDQISVRPF